MTIKLFNRTLALALSFTVSLVACGGGEKPADKAGKGDKSKQASKNGPEAGKDTPEVNKDPEPEVPALDPKVEKAVGLANKLAAEPTRADAILEEAGMDRASFQTMLYDIAHDPELSKSYAVAREA